MLTLNPSNIGDVSEALNSLCLREFQTIGEAISTLTLSTITSLPNSPADLTPYSAQNDPHGFAAKAYHEELKQNKIEIETRKRELLKLYGYVTSILSRESRELVISDAKYSGIQTATNGFQLWELVYALHTTGSTLESVDSRKDRAATEYAELRQDSSTDTTTHYQNFKLAVKKFNDLQTDAAAKLSDLAQAIRFLKSLN
jgi:hypothetical protein